MSEDIELGARFISNYSTLLSTVWKDEAELNRLLADPKAYAVEKHLPVEEGAVVTVDRTAHESLLHKNEVVDAWTGTPGAHVLLVPANAPTELAELTDAELDAVAAGANNNVNIIAIVL
jgi:hypothetical protein